jgi:hypothetical protein
LGRRALARRNPYEPMKTCGSNTRDSRVRRSYQFGATARPQMRFSRIGGEARSSGGFEVGAGVRGAVGVGHPLAGDHQRHGHHHPVTGEPIHGAEDYVLYPCPQVTRGLSRGNCCAAVMAQRTRPAKTGFAISVAVLPAALGGVLAGTRRGRRFAAGAATVLLALTLVFRTSHVVIASTGMFHGEGRPLPAAEAAFSGVPPRSFSSSLARLSSIRYPSRQWMFGTEGIPQTAPGVAPNS